MALLAGDDTSVCGQDLPLLTMRLTWLHGEKQAFVRPAQSQRSEPRQGRRSTRARVCAIGEGKMTGKAAHAVRALKNQAGSRQWLKVNFRRAH